MKILVVDDHALVREGLREVLKGLDEQIHVLEAPACSRAFELAALHPDLDLVLLDYHLPDMNGLAALSIFGKNHPELPIIMLSGSVNPKVMRQVLAQGAAGFMTKSGLSDDLLGVIRRVLEGEIFTPPELLNLSGSLQADELESTPARFVLTPRQEEVLYLLMDGHSNKDISRSLDLSEETVKNHVSAILRGFDVQTRIQAVIAASSHGYFKPLPLV
ncbi:response regulator transcription factor [Rhodoferax sp. PAMC 29310]|uniref:response regulator n=1 Tax=Rhodoferax sp. PAMC 29310 TaxID=2822760 RepID=UPI001B33A4B7|nr:response regulator transcription factor [Rhodoferax sp. PAMC 29310]